MNTLNSTVSNKCKLENNRPIKIGFVGAGRDVGLTELSSCFAIWISKEYFLNYKNPSVAFFQLAPLEAHNRNFFAEYTLSRHIGKYDFVDIFADLLINKTSKYESNFKMNKLPNSSLGVNWLVPSYNFYNLTNDESCIAEEQHYNDEIYRISSSLFSDDDISVVIYNIGRGLKKESLLNDMDILIAVSSAYRNNLEYAYEDIRAIETFRSNGGAFLWLVNGYTKGLPKSFIREKLRGGNIKFFNNIEPERLMNCKYDRIFLCEDNEIKEALWKLYKSIFKNFEKLIFRG